MILYFPSISSLDIQLIFVLMADNIIFILGFFLYSLFWYFVLVSIVKVLYSCRRLGALRIRHWLPLCTKSLWLVNLNHYRSFFMPLHSLASDSQMLWNVGRTMFLLWFRVYVKLQALFANHCHLISGSKQNSDLWVLRFVNRLLHSCQLDRNHKDQGISIE